MATDLQIMQGGSMALPAHLAEAFTGVEPIITTRDPIPALTFRGKVWKVVLNGEESPLVNKEGDPISTVRVIILNHNPNRSRAFYPGSYTEGENKAPECWSSDGVVPDADVRKPCAQTCASCPNSVKGSRISDNNKQVTACTPFRNVAVVPSHQLEFQPLRLRLPQTSIWDKENDANEAQGWYAYDQFLDTLRTKMKVTHPGMVVTKIKFDMNSAYPKLLFQPERWVEAGEVPLIKAAMAHDTIPRLIGTDEKTPAIREAAPAPSVTVTGAVESTVVAEAPPEAPAPLNTTAAAKPAMVVEDDEPAPIMPAAAPAAEPVAEKPAKTTKAKPAVVDAVPEEAVAEKPKGISTLVSEWDD